VLDVSALPGALDLIVGLVGTDIRVEVKKPGYRAADFTPLELTTIRDWRGRQPAVISTADEAIELITVIRREARARKKRG